MTYVLQAALTHLKPFICLLTFNILKSLQKNDMVSVSVGVSQTVETEKLEMLGRRKCY